MVNEMSDGKEYLGLAANLLFRQLSSEALEKISRPMVEEAHKAGDTIFLKDERGDSLVNSSISVFQSQVGHKINSSLTPKAILVQVAEYRQRLVRNLMVKGF